MAERVRLESEYNRKVIRGSNPLVSARISRVLGPTGDQPQVENPGPTAASNVALHYFFSRGKFLDSQSADLSIKVGLTYSLKGR